MEQTASELCMEALDDFSQSEPIALLIIFTNEAGQIAVKSTCSASHAIGLAEYAKAEALARIMGNPTQ